MSEVSEGKVSKSGSYAGNMGGEGGQSIQPWRPFLKTLALTLMETGVLKCSKQKCDIIGPFS